MTAASRNGWLHVLVGPGTNAGRWAPVVSSAAAISGLRPVNEPRPFPESPPHRGVLAVAEATEDPVLVLPPPSPETATRPTATVWPGSLLVPIDRSVTERRILRKWIARSSSRQASRLQQIHVLTESTRPAMWEGPGHHAQAWWDEVRLRHQMGSASMSVSSGDPATEILATSRHADLTLVFWRGRTSPNRAPVLRQIVDNATGPVLLVRSSPPASPPPRPATEAGIPVHDAHEAISLALATGRHGPQNETVEAGAAVIDRQGLDDLIQALSSRGYRTLGPVVRDGAIGHGEISATADLPVGFHDEQGPGSYRLHQDGGDALFEWAVGPASWKATFFPPKETVWRATDEDGHISIQEPPSDPTPVAIVGARPCELAAIHVLDRTLADGAVPDPGYARRRAGSFVVVAECGTPASTCFCTSMKTGPGATTGYDLAMTELPGPDGNHRYLVRAGSARGAEVLEGIGLSMRPLRTICLAVTRSSPGHRSTCREHSTPMTCPGCWPGTSTIRDGVRLPTAACPAGTARWSARPASAATWTMSVT